MPGRCVRRRVVRRSIVGVDACALSADARWAKSSMKGGRKIDVGHRAVCGKSLEGFLPVSHGVLSLNQALGSSRRVWAEDGGG